MRARAVSVGLPVGCIPSELPPVIAHHRSRCPLFCPRFAPSSLDRPPQNAVADFEGFGIDAVSDVEQLLERLNSLADFHVIVGRLAPSRRRVEPVEGSNAPGSDKEPEQTQAGAVGYIHDTCCKLLPHGFLYCLRRIFHS